MSANENTSSDTGNDSGHIQTVSTSGSQLPSATVSRASLLGTRTAAQKVADSITALLDSDGDISDVDLSSPVLQNTTITSDIDADSPTQATSKNDAGTVLPIDDRRDQYPLTSFGDATPPPPSSGLESDTTSPLSSLSRTPSPPPLQRPAPAMQPSATTQKKPPIVQRPPPPIKLESPPIDQQPHQQLQQPSTDPMAIGPATTKRPNRPAKVYEVECTHTDICTCPMHAAHPSARYPPLSAKPIGTVKGRYPHFSEWALSGTQWPESGMRSTLRRNSNG